MKGSSFTSRLDRMTYQTNFNDLTPSRKWRSSKHRLLVLEVWTSPIKVSRTRIVTKPFLIFGLRSGRHTARPSAQRQAKTTARPRFKAVQELLRSVTRRYQKVPSSRLPRAVVESMQSTNSYSICGKHAANEDVENLHHQDRLFCAKRQRRNNTGEKSCNLDNGWMRKARERQTMFGLCQSMNRLTIRKRSLNLLDLPAELRNKIYRMVFEGDEEAITVGSLGYNHYQDSS